MAAPTSFGSGSWEKRPRLPAHHNQSFLPAQIFQRERPDLTGAQAHTRQDQKNRVGTAASGRFPVDRLQYLLYLVRRKGARQG
jgi:hypothetical protein